MENIWRRKGREQNWITRQTLFFSSRPMRFPCALSFHFQNESRRQTTDQMGKNWRTKGEKKVGQANRRSVCPVPCPPFRFPIFVSIFKNIQTDREHRKKLKPHKQHQKEYSGNAIFCKKCGKTTTTTQQTSK